ncbi:uncharacterized protein LOC133485873 isoform X3 [Phyllopteryx taeniolatus]|uniref:uncharacterized protein LOC133485873 isoform X3 n=1 Tax=Phyllopteryx taeniolatus TaxID=161469 RepID=UPI002AD417D6|nr:uncharacterized protein LOC133485873 isoform X3 [Phyllopteryx taeniolatus]
MAATRELAGSLVVDENEAAAVVLKCPVTRKDGDDEAAMLELAERRPRDPRGLNGSTELRWEEEEEEKEEKAAAGATGVRTKSAKPQKCEQAAGDIGRLRPPESLPVTPRLPASRPHSTGSDSEVVVPPCSGKAQRTRPRSGTRAAVVASDGCGVDEEPPTVANGGCRAATEARNDGGRPVSVDPPEPDSPDPSASSEPSDDTSLSEEEEEACAGSDRVVRPHTLRTKPNLCVSLSCDATPLSPADADEGGFSFEKRSDLRGVFEAGRRKSAPEADLRAQANCDETALTHKRFGIVHFFTRNLFPRRAKESALPPSHNAPGWRLFGKARLDAKEEEGKGGELASSPTEQVSPQRPPTAGRRKNLDFEPLSTTALILEDRPPNLPAKSEEETQRHKLEYEEMVAGAKRRDKVKAVGPWAIPALTSVRRSRRRLPSRPAYLMDPAAAKRTSRIKMKQVEGRSEEEAADEGETSARGQHLQCHGGVEHAHPAALGRREGHASCEGIVVARPSPQRARTRVAPRHRKRAQHHSGAVRHLPVSRQREMEELQRDQLGQQRHRERRRRLAGRQGVQPGPHQVGHLQNFPLTLHIPEGRSLPRRPPQRPGSVHVLPT